MEYARRMKVLELEILRHDKEGDCVDSEVNEGSSEENTVSGCFCTIVSMSSLWLLTVLIGCHSRANCGDLPADFGVLQYDHGKQPEAISSRIMIRLHCPCRMVR